MSPPDRDLLGTAALGIYRELTQSAPHPAGYPDRDLPQHTAEELGIQLGPAKAEPMHLPKILRPGAPTGPGPCRRGKRVHRKTEELSFSETPGSAGDSRIEESHDRLQHVFGSKPVSPMNPEHLSVPAQHHRLVAVQHHSFDFTKSQCFQTCRQRILKQIELPRGPAAPRPRWLHNP